MARMSPNGLPSNRRRRPRGKGPGKETRPTPDLRRPEGPWWCAIQRRRSLARHLSSSRDRRGLSCDRNRWRRGSSIPRPILLAPFRRLQKIHRRRTWSHLSFEERPFVSDVLVRSISNNPRQRDFFLSRDSFESLVHI